MYAIIEVGGRQYSVQKGDVLEVEKQEKAQEEKDITLEKVLLVSKGSSVEIGKPYVKGAHIVAQVMAQTKGPKIMSFKYRRRKNSHWHKGHRQQLTRIKIKEITLG
jgi:large subunit ribosomal protein L21